MKHGRNCDLYVTWDIGNGESREGLKRRVYECKIRNVDIENLPFLVYRLSGRGSWRTLAQGGQSRGRGQPQQRSFCECAEKCSRSLIKLMCRF